MSRVYVGKLSYRAREKDVERFFKGYGKILEVDLKNGYGFVEFDDPRDADDAVCDLNGKDLCGKRVIVEHTIGQRRDGGSRPGRSTILVYSLVHNTFVYINTQRCNAYAIIKAPNMVVFHALSI
uniref:Serine and arginine rich splicing factor 4 n=1 Tax=Cyprinus carpio TaxID=7962 RepID=A0A8C1M8S7_CYPCA